MGIEGNRREGAYRTERDGLPTHRTAQDYLSLTSLLVAADVEELRTAEDIGEGVRVGIVGLDPRDLDPRRGEDRGGDLPIERGDRPLQVVVRSDVHGRSVVLLAQAVEEEGVHVVADPEREDPRPRSVGLPGVGDDLCWFYLPHSRLPIGEKDQVVRAIVGLEKGEGSSERFVDVRPPVCLEFLHPPGCRGDVIRRDREEGVGLRPRVVAERDHGETVIWIQIPEDEFERLLRLRDLVSGHAPRRVEDED